VHYKFDEQTVKSKFLGDGRSQGDVLSKVVSQRERPPTSRNGSSSVTIWKNHTSNLLLSRNVMTVMVSQNSSGIMRSGICHDRNTCANNNNFGCQRMTSRTIVSSDVKFPLS